MKFPEKLRLLQPSVIENSKVPVWLSRISPITIYAISFGIWVFCRAVLTKTTRRHETIHFQQQLELLFILQWILYGLFWLVGLIVHRDATMAYYANPFEQEAYTNEKRPTYLKKRELYSWRHYSIYAYNRVNGKQGSGGRR